MNRPADSLPVRVLTLGCKVNQHESACLLERLCGAGRPWREARRGEQAGLVVVNTCAVTARAEAESRRLVARARREAPRVVVTGCGLEAAPQLAAGCELALGNADKPLLADRLLGLDSGGAPGLLGAANRFGGRARATLKVQDGCNGGCTYCIVPRLRGRSVSVREEEILAEVERLSGLGFTEVVLCAIHLGAWGADQPPARAKGLPGLLSALTAAIQHQGLPLRLRLSSLDPPEACAVLPQLTGGSGSLCRHLHVSLQSGSDPVLGRMGRRYRTESFSELVTSATGAIPGVSVGCDVIAGFPGESPGEFADTLSLLEGLPISYLHVFPFSARPGTLAARMPDLLPAAERSRRAALLRALSERKRKAFHQAQVGREAQAIVQGRDRATGLVKALTDNYIPVLIDVSGGRGRLAPRRLVRVRIDRVVDSRVVASAL